MVQGTLLKNRGIIQIVGKDREIFLQGLITNDAQKIKFTQSIYTALLSPQGKFQYDFFISAIKDGTDDSIWLLDCDLDRVDDLIKRMSIYKLRSEVTLENVTDKYSVIASWGDNKKLPPSMAGETQQREGGCAFFDPRLIEIGARMILPTEKMLEQIAELEKNNILTIATMDDYEYHRIKLGIPDGQRDIIVDKGILLECGFDELNAIDWEKGCYMGQELTARTRYRGLVRKRLVPVQIIGEVPHYQTPIIQNLIEVGELRSTSQDWGIAMIRLEALHKALPFSCGSATVTPHIPHWMCLPSLEGEE